MKFVVVDSRDGSERPVESLMTVCCKVQITDQAGQILGIGHICSPLFEVMDEAREDRFRELAAECLSTAAAAARSNQAANYAMIRSFVRQERPAPTPLHPQSDTHGDPHPEGTP